MSIWVIVIIIIILAVLIFGYLCYNKYSGGEVTFSIDRDNAEKLINALNNKIIFNDPYNVDGTNTTKITNMKSAILRLVKDANNNEEIGNEYTTIDLKFYAYIDMNINVKLMDIIMACRCTVNKRDNHVTNNYNVNLVVRYFNDLINIKKLATINNFESQLNNSAATQDNLNRTFRLLFFNKYIDSGVTFMEDKKLVQYLILSIINENNYKEIYVLLKYKYKLFKSNNEQFDGNDNNYIENFYNTTYQKELFDKINTYIGTVVTILDDNLIKSMYNYYLNVKDNYIKYLAANYTLWLLDFLTHIPVRFAHDNFKQIPGYNNDINVDNYINYYHDIEIYKNTTYTFVNETMKELSVKTIYGIMYDKMDLFKTDQAYKLENIDNGNEYNTNIDNIELILLVVQLLNFDTLASMWDTTKSKKSNLDIIIINIISNLTNYIKIDNFELPTDFIINLLKNYNKNDILFNDIKTELINQSESYNKIKVFIPTSINTHTNDFWRIMKIKHYNKLNFDIIYRINIYVKLMILKDDGNNIDCLITFNDICGQSYKLFTTSTPINLNDEADSSGEDNKKMKICVGLDETDPIKSYEHKDNDDVGDNDICLMNKLKTMGVIFQYNNKIVVNEYKNLNLCNYNFEYNYNDYAEVFPNAKYNIEFLRKEKFYICNNDNFINISNKVSNYLKWELKDLDEFHTEYYKDQTSVNNLLLTNVTDFVQKTSLNYTIDYFNNIIGKNYTKYKINTKCIYFILQNNHPIPEYHAIRNINKIKINKEYLKHMIILFPEINKPAINDTLGNFYNNQFSYKNTINSNNDSNILVTDSANIINNSDRENPLRNEAILESGLGSANSNSQSTTYVQKSLYYSNQLREINLQLIETNKQIMNIYKNMNEYEESNESQNLNKSLIDNSHILEQEREQINEMLQDFQTIDAANKNSNLVVTSNYYKYIIFLFIVILLIILIIIVSLT